MAFRAGLIFVVVALAATAAMALSSEHTFSFRLGVEPDGHGLVADALDQLDEEMMMESDTVRRQLAQSRYISYGAMARGNVPCNQRGRSYYNCNSHQQANPYNRGCTRATKCARNNR